MDEAYPIFKFNKRGLIHVPDDDARGLNRAAFRQDGDQVEQLECVYNAGDQQEKGRRRNAAAA